MLYTDFSIKIQNNGYFSESIPVTRSIHQGGCVSAELFIICAETLAHMIRRSDKIQGVQIQQILNLINQFADDLNSTLKFEQESLDEILDIFEKFRRNSGFTLSYEKTTIYRIGSLRNSVARLYTRYPIQWTNDPICILGVWVTPNLEQCFEMNYNPAIEKIQAVLDMWKNRNLSIIGRISIVNTLVASILVHKMIVLPYMPQKYIDKIENQIMRFIWQDKKAKISKRILQANKSEGGLNLVNIRRRETSLKITWIQILEQDEKMAEIAYFFLSPTLKGDIWKCNLNSKDIKQLFNRENPFWRDILIAWSEYHYNTEQLHEQTIWYNSNLRLKGRPFLWTKYYEKGLLWISQIVYNNKLIDRHEAKELYDLNFIDLLTLYHVYISAPETSKMDKNKNSNNIMCLHEQCILTKNLSAKIYKEICSDRDLLQHKAKKWQEEFCTKFSTEELTKYLKSIYAITNSAKYRSFQYRLLQRSIITNKQLFKWKKRNTDKCTFCDCFEETYTHLFATCPVIQGFWENVSNLLREFGKEPKTFLPKQIICNDMYTPTINVGNLVILVAKQYIYRQRCWDKQPNFNEFKSIMYNVKNIEKYNAVCSGNLNKHLQKWGLHKPENPESSMNIDEYLLFYVNNIEQ